MNKAYTAAFALLGGIALGGVAVQGLHAQATPKIYVVNEIDVKNLAAFKTYTDAQQVLIEKNGGKFIIRGGKTTSIDGTPPKRLTVYVFDSLEKEQAWQNDPEQKELMAMRASSATFRAYTVEGVPQ